MTPRALRLRRTGAAAACALLALASCDDYRSPTAPANPVLAPVDPRWSVQWTLSEATPSGDCLVDYLNRNRASISRYALLFFQHAADRASLGFQWDHRNGNGFWPDEFEGTIAADGVILASIPTASVGGTHSDPWGELCYWQWTRQSGELSATLAPDGRSMSGTIVESFRVENPPPGTTFTIHSHFTATAR